MKWQGRRQSGNIVDRRGSGGRRSSGAAVGGGGLGILAIVAIGWMLGVDLTPLLGDQGAAPQDQPRRELTAEERRMGEFVGVVLADSEEVWTRIFREQTDAEYRPTRLVLYSGGTGSACGAASNAVGPFYCPADQQVYLDTDFFALMQDRLGAGGDFAFAYVVAHEVAHHVQNQLGVMAWSQRARQGATEAGANEVSVRVELMADCLSGIFARHLDRQGYLDRGDVAEAMNAARAIGDDTLQRNAGRRPVPDSFTHGSSAQREGWFDRGYRSGRIADCDTTTVPSARL